MTLRDDESNLDAELKWAAGRPCSEWPSMDDLPSSSNEDSYEACLTRVEKDFLAKYESDKPGGIYSLNQNPDVTNMGTNGQAGK